MKDIKMTVDMEAMSITKDDEVTKCLTKSEMFRKMYDMGAEISEISKATGSHYSFVYGVIQNSREIRTTEKHSKSNEFREMFDKGLKVGEIAKQTNSNYSFVFGVIKKYKQQLAAK